MTVTLIRVTISPMTGGAKKITEPDPTAVPLVIEEDWEPSLDSPLPLMRCVAITDEDTYERCGKWSVRGLSTCVTHSGYESYPTVRVYADTIVESARLRLMGMADMAVDALVDLLGPGTKQNVRLRAAEITLDRAGVVVPVQEQKVDVTINSGPSPTAILEERLSRLAARNVAAEHVINPLPALGAGQGVDGDEDHYTVADSTTRDDNVVDEVNTVEDGVVD